MMAFLSSQGGVWLKVYSSGLSGRRPRLQLSCKRLRETSYLQVQMRHRWKCPVLMNHGELGQSTNPIRPDGDDATSTNLPGTTSLLAVVHRAQTDTVGAWISEWLQIRVFSAKTLPVPMSIAPNAAGTGTVLNFYAADGLVRGTLEISCFLEADQENCVTVQVSSRSRFRNPAGLMSASLPGERGIVRNLFASMQGQFGADNVQVLYKPAYIRLGLRAQPQRPYRGISAGSGSQNNNLNAKWSQGLPVNPARSFGIVFVAEIRDVAVCTVLKMIEDWGPSVQFCGRSFRTPLAFSTELLPKGGARFVLSRDWEIVVRARQLRDGREAFVKSWEGTYITKQRDGRESVLVSVSTNAPEEPITQGVLKQLARDLRSVFRNSRIHYPG